MRIAIFLVYSPAIFGNLCDLGLARGDGMFIGGNGILSWGGTFWGMDGGSLGVEVVRQEGKDLTRVFGGELVPELVDRVLRVLFLHLPPALLRGRVVVDRVGAALGTFAGDLEVGVSRSSGSTSSSSFRAAQSSHDGQQLVRMEGEVEGWG